MWPQNLCPGLQAAIAKELEISVKKLFEQLRDANDKESKRISENLLKVFCSGGFFLVRLFVLSLFFRH